MADSTTLTIDIIILPTNYGEPGGRVDENDWLGHDADGIYGTVEHSKPQHEPVSPIHDQDETPRLQYDPTLDKLDSLDSGDIE